MRVRYYNVPIGWYYIFYLFFLLFWLRIVLALNPNLTYWGFVNRWRTVQMASRSFGLRNSDPQLTEITNTVLWTATIKLPVVPDGIPTRPDHGCQLGHRTCWLCSQHELWTQPQRDSRAFQHQSGLFLVSGVLRWAIQVSFWWHVCLQSPKFGRRGWTSKRVQPMTHYER